jgi:signal transduction histidine kinase
MTTLIPSSASKSDTTTPELALARLIGEINKQMISGVDYVRVLDFLFSSLDLIIPFDRIGIALVDVDGADARLHLTWVKSKLPGSALAKNYSALIRGSSLEKLLQTKQPRILNDLIEYSALHPGSHSTKLILQDGIRSSLTCPLSANDKQIGVIFFSSALSNTYQDAHVASFLTIADEISLVIDLARLKVQTSSAHDQSTNLAMVLHDLRSPLSVIHGFVQTSFTKEWYQQLDRDGKHVFEVLQRNAANMLDLLNELAEMSQLKAQEAKLKTELIPLRDFCHEMANFGEILSDKKKISFSTEIAEDVPAECFFNKEGIRRVLQNLFTNAVKFSPRHKAIIFKVSFVKDALSFLVDDEGLGIDEAEFSKLFQEFGKTKTRPTEGESSTGLGLAIARRIVEQHDGKISVKSRLGHGSTFTFSIPYRAAG